MEKWRKNCRNFLLKKVANKKSSKNRSPVIKKCDKFYVKRNGYNNSFNNWIDKNTLLNKMCYYP